MNGWLIVGAVLGVYALFVFVIYRTGLMARWKMSFYGPFIMWRTERGKDTVDWLAKPRRFWIAFAALSMVLVALAMAAMFALVVTSALTVVSVRTEPTPPDQILVIPGVNPMIPLWYGIFALAIAIIVHEFSHGILTRVANLDIRSMGILYLVVPMGAFVEPDEDGLAATSRRKRMRVFAAGPGANIVFGLLCALVFSWLFMASVAPIEEGAVVTTVVNEPAAPAYDAGIRPLMEIVEINGTRILSPDDLDGYDGAAPGQSVSVVVRDGSQRRTIDGVVSGVFVVGATEDLPAYRAGIRDGMIIAYLDSEEIRSPDGFTDAMDARAPGQSVNVTVLVRSGANWTRQVISNITLADKYDYYRGIYGGQPLSGDAERQLDSFRGKGMLGVSTLYLGISTQPAGEVFETLAHPIGSADNAQERRQNVLNYVIIYPVQHTILPLASPFTDLYVVDEGSPMAALPDWMFWGLANVFYYLFWLNILLGTFNSLPMVPLDGGFLFRDGLGAIVARARPRMPAERREAVVKNISSSLAFLVFFMLLVTIIVPYVWAA